MPLHLSFVLENLKNVHFSRKFESERNLQAEIPWHFLVLTKNTEPYVYIKPENDNSLFPINSSCYEMAGYA